VHIQIRKELQDFAIHKDLICHHSLYFKAAFTSGLEESQTGIMTFSEIKVSVFELFFNWLYNQSVWNESADRSEWPEMNDLIELYVLPTMSRCHA
jgi:hypothetical protein